VYIQAQQVVEEIIPRCNISEHSANARLTFIEQGGGHRVDRKSQQEQTEKKVSSLRSVFSCSNYKPDEALACLFSLSSPVTFRFGLRHHPPSFSLGVLI